MSIQDRGGPFVAGAFICRSILNEIGGIQSYIQVVDRFTIHGDSETMPKANVAFTTAVLLKSGGARGRGQVKLQVERPDASKGEELNLPVFFEGDGDRGVNLHIEMRLQVELEGLYWISVAYGDQFLSKIPFRIIYQPVIPGFGPK